MTFSVLLALCGEKYQKPVDSPYIGQAMPRYDIFFDVSMKTLFNKQLSCQRSEIPRLPYDVTVINDSTTPQPRLQFDLIKFADWIGHVGFSISKELKQP